MLKFTSITEYFRENYQVQDENLLAELEQVTEIRHVKEGDILMTLGEIPPKILFQAEGITRSYFVDSKGHEHTECFGGQFSLPLMPSGGLGERSNITMEVIKDGIVLAIPVEWVQNSLPRYMELQQILYRILADSARANAEIRRVLYLYDAPQRYEWFVSRFPDISENVSQRQAASFLHMSPETYCRIKKSMSRKSEPAAKEETTQAAEKDSQKEGEEERHMTHPDAP